MRKTVVSILIMSGVLLTASASLAQSVTRQHSSWIGLQYLFPAGDAGDFYDSGWAVTASSRKVMSPNFDFVLEGAWYNLLGSEFTVEGLDVKTTADDLSIGAMLAGGLFDFDGLQFGVKGGYFFYDIHEWDIMPMAQISFWRIALGAEYKWLGSTNWGSA